MKLSDSDMLKGTLRPIVVNGVFVGRRASGLERFAVETLRALDEMVPGGRFRLLVPKHADVSAVSDFKNIEIIRYGNFKGALWEQLELARYAHRHGMKVLSLTNTVPFRHADYACIHDVFYVTHAREFSRSLKGLLSMWWHRLHYRTIAKQGKIVFTVSEYSARQITDVLGIERTRIVVLGNGWEHMERITSDESIFRTFAGLERGRYFLAIGNRAPYKNIAWILAMAATYPESTWVIVGAPMRTARSDDRRLPNVIFTAHLSDGEMKALMENCRMLVHPSLDEGFGIPPLEALSLGRPILISRRAGLPEIYGDAAYWIDDPLKPDRGFEMQKKMDLKSQETAAVLARHTWKCVAGRLLDAFS